MNEQATPFKNSKNSKIVFVLSVLTSGYWWLSQNINVYSYKIIGAMYEYLWLGVLVSLFVLPIISIVLLIKEKWNIRSLNIYSFIIGVVTNIYLLF
ncbi:MAG TPA: hypothetical protein DCF33_22060 [Saprospirales bacterium]|nr:hypothetical protein [Saprospirales bacterium]